jgi:hypothetical protein
VQHGQFRQNALPPVRMGQAWEGGYNPSQALVPVQKITQAQMEEQRRKGVMLFLQCEMAKGPCLSSAEAFPH